MSLPHSTAEVLAIINTVGTSGITCADIFKKTKDNKITFVEDPAHVSKICFAARNKGLITSFLANKKNHQVITPKGTKLLSDYQAHIDDQADPELNQDAEQEESDTQPTSVVIGDHGLTDPLIGMAALSLESDTPAAAKVTLDAELAVKVAKEHGYTVLDPLDDLHKPLIDLITMLEAASALQPPAISDKFVKIDTLKRVGNILSDDIKHILDAIIPDLEQLEELEQLS
ncbi:MAG: hypothetical protein WCL60_06890 [Methylococcales bacterium]